MAQQGSNGGGHSKFRTAEEDAADRRAARDRKRRGGRRPAGLAGEPTGTVDRSRPGIRSLGRMRAERAQREAERLTNLVREAHRETLGHLDRFTGAQIPDGKGGTKRRWTDQQGLHGEELLRRYFFSPVVDEDSTEEPESLEELEERVGKRVVNEVRRRFAGACCLNNGVQGTPGQDQEWFPEALAAATEFHASRRAAAMAARNERRDQASV